MKNLILIFFCLISISLFSQIESYWIGGTPGKENVWKEAKNWSTHHVPDEYTHVIIKGQNSGHNAHPLVNEKIEVASIALQYGGILIITEKGKIKIDGQHTFSKGLISHGGRMINNGRIELKDIENFDYTYLKDIIQGNGILIANDSIIGIAQK